MKKVTMKQILNAGWKAGVALLGILAIVLVMEFWDERRNDEQYYTEEYLSDNVVMREYKWSRHNKRTEFYNIAMDKVVYVGKGTVESAHAKGDSLAVYFLDDTRGYMNVNTGELVIEPRFRHAWYFSEGLGAVTDKDRHLGFIDKTGNIAIPMKFYYDGNEYCSPIFKSGLCPVMDSNEKFGLIDRNGNWVMQPEFEYTEFEYGYWMLRKEDNHLMGLCDSIGNIIFPFEYDRISVTFDKTIILAKDGIQQEVTADGEVLNPFVVDYMMDITCDYGLGDEMMYQENENGIELRDEPSVKVAFEQQVEMSLKYAVYEISGKRGVIRRDNSKVVIPALYDEIEMVSPTVFKAELPNSSKYILYDINGNHLSS